MLFPYEKYHSTFWLTEETENYRLSDILRIDYLELPKAKKHTGCSLDQQDLKQQWMDFINAESKEELQMLADENEVFKRPVAEVIRLSGDAAIRAEYEARQKAIRDEMARMEYAVNVAVKEAEIRVAKETEIRVARETEIRVTRETEIRVAKETEIRVAKEAEIRVARNLLNMKLPISAIAAATGLSTAEIEQLRMDDESADKPNSAHETSK